MPLNFSAKTGFFALLLGAIASSTVLNACSTAAQDPTQASSAATTANATQDGHHDAMPHNSMDHHSLMDLGPADAEFDLRFIDAMIPHHEGAVVMAQEVLQKSKRPEIKNLAKTIIQAQEQEINQMKQWRTTWYPQAPSTPVAWHAQMGHSMAMSAEQMQAMRMSMDLGQGDDQFDLRFINAMIPHHEGAVVMATDVLKKSKRPEIQKLAQAIITAQKAEIAQMQQWKQAWYPQ